MLAYVFWHWPRPDIERGQYLDHLTAFHRTLAANKPPGFQRSVVFRIQGANWLNTDGEAYEEWYLLNDSAAMDPLNDGAVSGVCEEPHNRVAREAADGTGGLYRLRAGAGDLAKAKFATWFSKPAGVTYKDFYAELESLTSQPGVALWGRQMTLGPTTEFCIHSQTPVQLSASISVVSVQLNQEWAMV
jgi:hypothetical protein